MAEIPESDKIEIKIMAEALYKIDPYVFAWTQKFLTKDYLELNENFGEEWLDFMCAEIEEEHHKENETINKGGTSL